MVLMTLLLQALLIARPVPRRLAPSQHTQPQRPCSFMRLWLQALLLQVLLLLPPLLASHGERVVLLPLLLSPPQQQLPQPPLPELRLGEAQGAPHHSKGGRRSQRHVRTAWEQEKRMKWNGMGWDGMGSKQRDFMNSRLPSTSVCFMNPMRLHFVAPILIPRGSGEFLIWLPGSTSQCHPQGLNPTEEQSPKSNTVAAHSMTYLLCIYNPVPLGLRV